MHVVGTQIPIFRRQPDLGLTICAGDVNVARIPSPHHTTIRRFLGHFVSARAQETTVAQCGIEKTAPPFRSTYRINGLWRKIPRTRVETISRVSRPGLQYTADA